MVKENTSTTSKTRIPVLILNGFLGSGKTTLLRRLLVQSREKELDLGVVVNDMSEQHEGGQRTSAGPRGDGFGKLSRVRHH